MFDRCSNDFYRGSRVKLRFWRQHSELCTADGCLLMLRLRQCHVAYNHSRSCVGRQYTIIRNYLEDGTLALEPLLENRDGENASDLACPKLRRDRDRQPEPSLVMRAHYLIAE